MVVVDAHPPRAMTAAATALERFGPRADGRRLDPEWLATLATPVTLQALFGRGFDVDTVRSFVPLERAVARRLDVDPDREGPFRWRDEPPTGAEPFWLDPDQPSPGHRPLDGLAARIAEHAGLAATLERSGGAAADLHRVMVAAAPADTPCLAIPGGPWHPSFEAHTEAGHVAWFGWLAVVDRGDGSFAVILHTG